MIQAKPVSERRRIRLLHNPTKKRKASRRRARPNSGGELVALGYLNPPRRTMRKRKNKAKIVQMPARTRPRRRRNPDGAAALVRQPIDMLKAGAIAAGGLLVARQVPQIVLGPRNRGWVGYAANLITAALTGGLAARVFGPEAGAAAAIGGSLYTFNRILSEQTPPGKQLALSGVGDAQAAGHLGALVPGYWVHPVVKDRQGKPWVPNEIVEAAAQAVLQRLPQPTPAQSLGRLAGRYARY